MESKGQELIKKKNSLMSDRKQLIDLIKSIPISINVADDQELDAAAMEAMHESLKAWECTYFPGPLVYKNIVMLWRSRQSLRAASPTACIRKCSHMHVFDASLIAFGFLVGSTRPAQQNGKLFEVESKLISTEQALATLEAKASGANGDPGTLDIASKLLQTGDGDGPENRVRPYILILPRYDLLLNDRIWEPG